MYLDHKIYFIQEDGGQGLYQKHSLWAANETLTSRTLVKEFPKGDDVFRMEMVYNGEVYFTLDDGVHGVELMKTDGTRDGTVLVKDIHRGGLGSDPSWFGIVRGKADLHGQRPPFMARASGAPTGRGRERGWRGHWSGRAGIWM